MRVARAQLATALDLFIRDLDPVSIQCLACGGAEVVEGVAAIKGVEPFSTHMLQTFPNLDYPKLKGIRNKFWNAFKHLTDPKGVIRQDEDLLTNFSDAANDAALFCGWYDYMMIEQKLPIEVQVFQVWWYALNEDKLAAGTDLEPFGELFPNVKTQDRAEQKRLLRVTIEAWRENKDLLADPKTEPRLLERWH